MKKLLSIAAMCLLSIALYAQDVTVTRFLGIPVDGTKAAMISKLKAKGFKSIAYDSDMLKGEFNGRDVYINVVTNNNKVWRIMVSDVNELGEADIKIRFNDLCSQFERNRKYRTLSPNQSLSDDEEIGYGIRLHNKRYEAGFLQKESADAESSLSDWRRSVWFMISEGRQYGKFQILMYYDNEYNKANGEDL
ncbi:hypothetical protein HPS54_02365 [Prevotella sp. PCHR]|uniref:Uncharacterized protein n=1 Tax=Xylanibacter caecicola TaxID=2736294 RepID=A0ABX2AYS5_9BACT|nr:hypothetical protein [Xylanibacter caecicola]NPE24374.1 hypothetical protein [Xylanibacter caecicola]